MDMAAVNVQNRVNGALSQLPAEATKSGVTTEKQQNAELMTFALYSPDDRFDQTFLNNYMKINVEPRVKRIGGVGKAQLFGSNYSMRLWLKPDKMAGYRCLCHCIISCTGWDTVWWLVWMRCLGQEFWKPFSAISVMHWKIISSGSSIRK